MPNVHLVLPNGKMGFLKSYTVDTFYSPYRFTIRLDNFWVVVRTTDLSMIEYLAFSIKENKDPNILKSIVTENRADTKVFVTKPHGVSVSLTVPHIVGEVSISDWSDRLGGRKETVLEFKKRKMTFITHEGLDFYEAFSGHPSGLNALCLPEEILRLLFIDVVISKNGLPKFREKYERIAKGISLDELYDGSVARAQMFKDFLGSDFEKIFRLYGRKYAYLSR